MFMVRYLLVKTRMQNQRTGSYIGEFLFSCLPYFITIAYCLEPTLTLKWVIDFLRDFNIAIFIKKSNLKVWTIKKKSIKLYFHRRVDVQK